MKKALQISLARTLFTIEEDAYTRLSAYLESVRAHFATTEGRDDIVSDIEGRIAEQFTESGKTIITMSEVDSVIGTMGRAEDLGGESQDGDGAAPSDTQNTRKLYRDLDNAVIGGVSAGFAKYFGIDALWIRLLFIFLVVSTGLGVIIYIILWIVIPAAKTPSQKLEMSGSPINLETLSETLREKFNEVDTHRDGRLSRAFGRLGRALRLIITGIGSRIIPLVRIVLGVILSAASLIGIVASSIFALVVVTSPVDRFIDFPLTDIMSLPHAYSMVGAAYLALFIPLVFIFIFGASLLRKKSLMSSPFGFGLLGLWCLALVALGALGFRTGLSYSDYIRTNPRYQTITTSIPLSESVSSVAIDRNIELTIKQGAVPSLISEARKIDSDRYEITLADKTLSITTLPLIKRCIFCDTRRAHYTLTVPDLTSIKLSDGSSADVTLDVPELSVTARDGAYVVLTGNVASTTLSARDGSSINASDFKAESAIVTARDGAHVQVFATQKLSVTAEDGSYISYTGDPQLIKTVRDGAFVEASNER